MFTRYREIGQLCCIGLLCCIVIIESTQLNARSEVLKKMATDAKNKTLQKLIYDNVQSIINYERLLMTKSNDSDDSGPKAQEMNTTSDVLQREEVRDIESDSGKQHYVRVARGETSDTTDERDRLLEKEDDLDNQVIPGPGRF